MKNKGILIFIFTVALGIILLMCFRQPDKGDEEKVTQVGTMDWDEGATQNGNKGQDETANPDCTTINGETIPQYAGKMFVDVNNGIPLFRDEEKTTKCFEIYSELDNLGRCGAAYANLGKELMPEQPRGNIGNIKPTGWHTVKYNELIEGNYLYNRCHLIAYNLAGENDNIKNLITGTRYMNIMGMQPFENMVADYINSTGNHVLYRTTPIFDGDNLLVSGVTIEAWSVEDEGNGICFYVYCYNVQPGIVIDYATGDSRLDDNNGKQGTAYVLNISSKKFHRPDCKGVSDMSDKNKREYEGTREAVIEMGYSPCNICKP